MICFVFTTFLAGAQESATVNAIKKISAYKKTIKTEPEQQMLELKKEIPNIVYDLRYATTNNFMHRCMYPCGTDVTFLRKPAASALRHVQEALNEQGLGIKVFDAYRPYSVSKKFWELVHDARYVANPINGSDHNRGTAIDLTLINLKSGKELDMGTGFDNFSEAAHQTCTSLPDTVLHNRNLLKAVMIKNGFQPLSTEWWHYTFKSPLKFEVLDLPFKKL